MLTHLQVWTALDRLAARAKLTPSGLAKKAGLDPTTFNKSKRITPEGRPRWPSTESVAKSLAATGTKADTFVSLIPDCGKRAISNVPSTGCAGAGAAASQTARVVSGHCPVGPRRLCPSCNQRQCGPRHAPTAHRPAHRL